MHSIYATSFEKHNKKLVLVFSFKTKNTQLTGWKRVEVARWNKKKDLIDCQGSSQVVYPDTEQKKMGSY